MQNVLKCQLGSPEDWPEHRKTEASSYKVVSN